jgi:hypothetical protein
MHSCVLYAGLVSMSSIHYLYSLKVLNGIVEAVRVIHTKARHSTAGDPLQDEAVRRFEDFLLLDADGNELVDIKKSPAMRSRAAY